MKYLEKMKIQEKMREYHSALREKISVVDSSGKRKLNSFYFLSGELAAYILLNSWIKRMRKGQEIINEVTKEDFLIITNIVNESYLDYEEYEENSFYLWHQIMCTLGSEAMREFNTLIYALATLAELESGLEESVTLIANVNDSDLMDPDLTAYAYSVAHDYLISKERDFLQRFAEAQFGINEYEGELHKLHFNLFQ